MLNILVERLPNAVKTTTSGMESTSMERSRSLEVNLLVLLSLVGLITAVSYRIENVPNPRTNYRDCGRQLKSWLCDPGAVLTRAQADRLDLAIIDVISSTPCPCFSSKCPADEDGIIISILVVPKIDVPASSSVDAEMRSWVSQLATSRWKFGTCDNDITIVHSRDDRRVVAYAGSIANSKIGGTACLTKIVQGAAPYFSGPYSAEGLEYIVTSFKKVFQGNSCPNPEDSPGHQLSSRPNSNSNSNVNNNNNNNNNNYNTNMNHGSSGSSGAGSSSSSHDGHSGSTYHFYDSGVDINDTHLPWWAIMLIILGISLVISLIISIICCICCPGRAPGCCVFPCCCGGCYEHGHPAGKP
ncbi:uncharacterized protein LOC106179880 [Lingula anatina]|uniref:Uncharacterized protein LOC106179880 n=1 Tax=Lingula anatina TaxID=7574 RepID=A0A1S3KA57_LINAN|nr:uncharacterized protein LOC106179880 [Lingula anatina]|eukprot:XP_013419131.1 uncharacterized protein LOC106179880 [Lingula anatina]